MAIYKTKGIILYRKDFSESDRIITIFSEDYGKIYTIAKGSRRVTSRLGGHLELFNYCELFLASGRNFDIISQVEVLNSFQPLKSNLLKTSVVYYLTELVLKLTRERQENHLIFNLLKETFDCLSKNKNFDILSRWFELRIIEIIGFRPQFKLCIHCRKEIDRKTEHIFFGPDLGGALCTSCIKYDSLSLRVDPEVLKTLIILQNSKLKDISQIEYKKEIIAEIEKLMNFYITFILEKNLKSKKFIEKVKLSFGENYLF